MLKTDNVHYGKILQILVKYLQVKNADRFPYRHKYFEIKIFDTTNGAAQHGVLLQRHGPRCAAYFLQKSM